MDFPGFLQTSLIPKGSERLVWIGATIHLSSVPISLPGA